MTARGWQQRGFFGAALGGLAGLMLTVAIGCGSSPEAALGTYTGTLEGGMAAIGGEHAGWLLRGTSAGDVEVDVGKVHDEAETLKGRRVQIIGALVQREGPERGIRQVLIAETLRLAHDRG